MSLHYDMERKERDKLIQEIGEGVVVKRVIVDRHHRNGPEIHEISSTGIITIYNKRTKKMITKLIARVGQIERYYNPWEHIPNELFKNALEHQRKGYNFY